MFWGQRKFGLLGISIFSIILLSGSFSFDEASAATFPVDIKLILTEVGVPIIMQEWDVFGGGTALEAVTDGCVPPPPTDPTCDLKYVE